MARVPSPADQPGRVLIRVRYSYVSTGTELASLRPDAGLSASERSVARAQAKAQLVARYLGAAARNPRLALRRSLQLAEHALVRARAAATAKATHKGESSFENLEIEHIGYNIGYSVAGEIVGVGTGIEDLAIGDLVAACGAGLANHAEIVSIPRNLVVRVPKGVALEEAAASTIGSIALQGVRRTAPQLAERIVVIGLGLIGQLTVQLLKASGAVVIGHDLSAARCARARGFGARGATHDAQELQRLVRDLAAGHGADAVVITAASKSDALINLAMELCRRRGRVVIVGDVGLKPERTNFYRKEIDLLMSTSYGAGRYDASYEEGGRDYPLPYVRWTLNRNMQAFVDALESGQVSVKAVTDRVIPFDAAPETYRELANATGEPPLGVVLDYGAGSAGIESSVTIGGHRTAPREGPSIYALVGAGGFGTTLLVPQMDRLKDLYFLRGVVSRDVIRGGNFARQNRIEVLATDLAKALDHAELTHFVISTRHHEHARQVVQCLNAGRSVFVEKPLALTWDELDAVRGSFEKSSRRFLMVGFNRRFSPAARRLKEILAGRRSPLVMCYRVHAGYIAPDHWVQGPEGGGRNLGEACHMYDLMRHLAGAPVRSIEATAISAAPPVLRTDNFSATLGYEDGSIGTLVYTALGPEGGPGKERLEIYCDGEAFLLDDFKRLVRQSTGETLWESSETDKGHFDELKETGERIKAGLGAPIDFEELMETSAVALAINDRILGVEA